MSAAEGQSVTELTVKTLKSMCTDANFNAFIYVTVSVSSPNPTFQHCHGLDMYVG